MWEGIAVGLPEGWEGIAVGLPDGWALFPGCDTPAQKEVTFDAPPAAVSSLWNAVAFCAADPLACIFCQAVHSPNLD